MHKLVIAAVSAAALLSLPALAQTNNSSSNNETSTQSGSSASNMPSHEHAQIRQHLVEQLKQQGFTDIRVVPDSFLVHAKNKQGDPVVMIINPDSVFSVTQLEGTQTGSGSSSNSTSNEGSHAGSSSSSTSK